MRISANIDFWADGVTCFCHEAVARALGDAFGEVSIDSVDLAFQKYRGASESNLALERSAWYEFLRNGPRHAFTLPSGVTGVLSRYEVAFELPNDASGDEVERLRQFLASLASRRIEVVEGA